MTSPYGDSPQVDSPQPSSVLVPPLVNQESAPVNPLATIGPVPSPPVPRQLSQKDYAEMQAITNMEVRFNDARHSVGRASLLSFGAAVPDMGLDVLQQVAEDFYP